MKSQKIRVIGFLNQNDMSNKGLLRMIGKCDRRILAFQKSLSDSTYNQQAKDWANIMIDRLGAIREFLIVRYELSKTPSKNF